MYVKRTRAITSTTASMHVYMCMPRYNAGCLLLLTLPRAPDAAVVAHVKGVEVLGLALPTNLDVEVAVELRNVLRIDALRKGKRTFPSNHIEAKTQKKDEVRRGISLTVENNGEKKKNSTDRRCNPSMFWETT